MPTTDEINEIVGLLEQKTDSLKKAYLELQEENLRMKRIIREWESEKETLNLEITQWKEKCEMLKVANSILGSNEYKTDTKLKINMLIREIDACIAYFSE